MLILGNIYIYICIFTYTIYTHVHVPAKSSGPPKQPLNDSRYWIEISRDKMGSQSPSFNHKNTYLCTTVEEEGDRKILNGMLSRVRARERALKGLSETRTTRGRQSLYDFFRRVMII